MKVLVATEETQGQRDNDFCWAADGELVRFPFECNGERVDGPCGCRRAMGGMTSHKGTTTFKATAANQGFSRQDFEATLAASLRAGGWGKLMEPGEFSEWVRKETAELLRIAAKFPYGTVLERRGNRIQVRLNP